MPAQDVDHLPDAQPQLAPVETQLRQLDEALAAREPRSEDFGRGVNPRRADPPLQPAFAVEQLAFEGHRRRQLGMLRGQFGQRRDLARSRPFGGGGEATAEILHTSEAPPQTSDQVAPPR